MYVMAIIYDLTAGVYQKPCDEVTRKPDPLLAQSCLSLMKAGFTQRWMLSHPLLVTRIERAWLASDGQNQGEQ